VVLINATNLLKLSLGMLYSYNAIII